MLPGEIDGQRLLRALGRLGWKVTRVKGSHRVLKNAAGRTIVLAFHTTLSRNSVKRLLREAGVEEGQLATEL